MANVIEELLISLGMDSSAFRKGAKESEDALKKFGANADGESKKINAQTKAMGEGFNKTKNELISLSSVLIGSAGAKAFVSSVVQSQTKLAQLSQTLGANSRDLDAWAAAVRSVGGSKDDLFQSAKAIEDIYQQFRVNGKLSIEQAKAIEVFGIDPNHMQDPSKFLRELNEGMAKFKGTEQDKEFFAKALGLNSATFNLLRRSPQIVGPMVERMRELTSVSKENAEAAQRLQDRWAEFSQMLEGFGGNISSNVLPWLDKLSEKALKVGNELFKLDQKTGGVGSTAAGVAGTVAAGAGTAWSISKVFKGLMGGAKESAPAAAEATAAAAPSAAKSALPVGMKAAPGWMAGTGVTMVREAAKFTFKDWFKGILSAVSELNPLALKFIFDGLFGTSDEDIAILKAAEQAKKNAAAGASVPSVPSVSPGPPLAVPPIAGKQLPRGIRNNNPGNLEFAGQTGAVRENGGGGRFAAFKSMEEGVAALIRQFRLYQSRGLKSLDTIFPKYAPKSENNTAAYIAALQKKTGLQPGQAIDLEDQKLLATLLKAISSHENRGMQPSDDQIASGMKLAQMSRMSSAAPAAVARPAVSQTTTSETNINGPITVVTQATDANAIARDMNIALQKRVAMSSSSNGMTP
jgi:hypothetical protein